MDVRQKNEILGGLNISKKLGRHGRQPRLGLNLNFLISHLVATPLCYVVHTILPRLYLALIGDRNGHG